MWKFRHIWKIDFLSQYKNIARVFRETTYFLALKPHSRAEGRLNEDTHANIFPEVQRIGSMTPFFAGLFWRRIKKINKHEKVQIPVRRQNVNAFLYTKTSILHKINECVSSLNTLALTMQNPLPEISSRFCKHLVNIF